MVVVAVEVTVAGAPAIGAVVALVVALTGAALIEVVVAGVMVFVLASNGRSILLRVGGVPGTSSSKVNCEPAATPLDLNRNPAACAGVKLSPAVTGVLPSDCTILPFVGSAVARMR